MGLVHRARINHGVARVELVLTTGWCPFATTVLSDIEEAVRTVPGVDTADVEIVWDEAWSPARLAESARQKTALPPGPGHGRRSGVLRRTEMAPR